MENKLNIIHLPHGQGHPVHRQHRWDNLMKELSHQKISDYKIWEGIKTALGKTGCSQSHKNIVRDAKEKGLKYVISAEDDICFYGSFAYQYYLDNIPDEFDLYLGGWYGGSVNQENEIKKFSSTTLIMCHERFYDKFLNAPENMNLDVALNIIGGKFMVPPKMVCYQMPGFSETVNKDVDYSSLLIGKPHL